MSTLDLNAGMRFLPRYNTLVSPAALYLPSVAYVVLALWGHRAMKERSVPTWVAPCVKAYNVIQIIVCLYMTVGLFDVLGVPNLFGIGSEYTAAGEWFVFVHYLSKFLDWFDTLWMILKKKSSQQMSFLHLYHHATIGVVWGFLLSVGHGNGTARYGAWINSVTHVLMYSHYLWTSFGLTNPLKRYLTMWQISQFYSCFVHAICVLFVFHTYETNLPTQLGWLQFCYHITMIYLFTFKLHWVPRFIKGENTKAQGSASRAEQTMKKKA
jgi:elongation of very long chain fatty acids protein 4